MLDAGTSVNGGNRPPRGNGEGVAQASPLPNTNDISERVALGFMSGLGTDLALYGILGWDLGSRLPRRGASKPDTGRWGNRDVGRPARYGNASE
uniref:Uncharacterized protein n=1 Tax=Candidatus Kentrum sp. LFY TaxID=2126342 RepID=A0A450V7Q4_9GAMM|nr:MAG: hypothetical protein BECKLFY1418B_GA0070995_12092 [Candidatus Kentron sp. LFY]